MTATPNLVPSVDPLRPARGGRYEEHGVVVARRHPIRLFGEERWVGRTPHFAVGRLDGRLVVIHDLDPAELDNGITAVLHAELFAPGWLAGGDAFERIFVGIVATMDDDPLAAWELFYRNTLDRVADNDPVVEFGPIYRHAEALVASVQARSVLDLGSCFGFLPLRLRSGSAGPVDDVLACDVSPGTVDLLHRVSHRLGRPVTTLACDAARVPLPDAAVDVVLAVHLLEHVDAAHGERIVAEAMRLACRRVVIAVPFEEEHTLAYGHLRTFTLAGLRDLGDQVRGDGWTASTHEFHGGWLVLDRTLP